MIALLLAGLAQLAWASPGPGPGVGTAAPTAAVPASPVAAGSDGRAMRAVPAQAAVNPLSVAQPDGGSGEALLLVEIPAGSATKFETRADGLVEVNRFLRMPVVYPANYGALPSTLAGDGDPLDALVLTRAPLPPGVLVRFRPVAVLRMTDGGAEDHKLVGVPADAVDPGYGHIRDLGDLPPAERERIEAFFRVYKALPERDADSVSLAGWGDASQARRLLQEAMRRSAEARDARDP